jgi:hypothetical protein
MDKTCSTKTIILEVIDEIINGQSENPEGFMIDTDNKAEWALQKISEERADAERYIRVCKEMISEYEHKIRQKEEKLEKNTSFLRQGLQSYFTMVPHKKTKTQETYSLPSGKLKIKYQNPEFKKNDELLIKWLKENDMSDLVKTEEKPNWVDFKKKITVSGENIVTEDGLVVDGVEALERSPVFEIEV